MRFDQHHDQISFPIETLTKISGYTNDLVHRHIYLLCTRVNTDTSPEKKFILDLIPFIC